MLRVQTQPPVGLRVSTEGGTFATGGLPCTRRTVKLGGWVGIHTRNGEVGPMVAPHGSTTPARNPIRVLAVVACMVVATAALWSCSSENGGSSGPADTGDAATVAASPTGLDAQQLVGTWSSSGTEFQTWEPDGTFYSATKKYYDDGSWYVAGDKVDPFAWGTYTLDGSTLTMVEAPDSPSCPDTTATYEVTFDESGSLLLELREDVCAGRVAALAGVPHVKVEALSSEGSESTTPEATATQGAGPTTEDAWKPVDTWKVGTVGYLTWEPDGTWYVDQTPQGRVDPWAWGTYAFDGSTVIMDESPDATECPNSRGTYTVAWSDADTLRMDLIDENCDTRRYGQHAAMKHVRVTE